MMKSRLLFGILAVIVVALMGCKANVTQPETMESAPSQEASVPEPSAQEEQSQEQIAAINRNAIDGRDRVVCSGLQNQQDRTYCENNVIITKASDAKDSIMCDAIAEEAWKTSCKDSVILVTARDSKNPALCDQMSEKGRIPECKSLASQ